MSRNCYYHPEHALHNFCVNTQCALPLCPKCINIHLSQSSEKHHIQSLEDTQDMVKQQLQTSIQALLHNLNSLKNGQFTPDFCMKQYSSIVEKYREQAVKAINQHYDYIKRQLFQEIKSKYSCHLSNLITSLEQSHLQLRKFEKLLQEKPIECIIKIVSQQIILHIQKILEHISQKKQVFKMQLPRLQGIQCNKLKIIPGGIDFLVNKDVRQKEKSLENCIPLNQTSRFYNQGSADLNRIYQLEQKLIKLRSIY